jgi:hypothetical protein
MDTRFVLHAVEKNVQSLLGTEPRIPGCPAPSLVAVFTDLPTNEMKYAPLVSFSVWIDVKIRLTKDSNEIK